MVPSTCCMDWCCLPWSLIPWSLDPLIPDCSCSKPCISASAGCFPICWSEVEALELQPPGSALRSFEMEGIWSSDKFTRKPGIDYYTIQLLWISGFHQISPNETTQNRTWFSHLSWHYLTLFRWAGPAACPLPWWTHLQCCMTPGQVSCRGTQPPKESGFKMMWFMMMLQKYDGYWWLRFSKNSRYVI